MPRSDSSINNKNRRTIMNTKNFFKTVAMAMLMPAVLLTTSCSKGDDAVTNPEKPANTEAAETAVNKGYALPVTVNVTRQDNGTRATFDGSKLNFSAGDKLFVYGSATAAGSFAGTLDYDTEKGNFSGTIYTQNSYSSTADDLFTAASGEDLTATLLPNKYESTGFLSIDNSTTDIAYDDRLTVSFSNAFVASETAKATGVEQLSWERTSTYSSGFALSPENAILNFTISGLEAGAQDVELQIRHGLPYTVSGSVTPNASGVATFAIGVPAGANIRDTENNLTVGSSNFTLPSSTTFAAGKIYNITRSAIPGALIGQFSVSNTKKVHFSKGNLRYVSGTWSFFDHQYDCYDIYSSDARDKFGWSTSSPTYGMSTSSNISDYSGSFVDWGTVPGIGEGWYTLSHEEWYYLFNDRTDATSKYGYATVNDVHGIIILPDAFVDPNKNKGSNAFVGSTTYGWNANKYTAENWALMEAAGAVFLPAAGYREETTVKNVDSYGYYWSSSPDGEDGPYSVYFYSDYLDADYNDYRFWGQSVRLVRQVK